MPSPCFHPPCPVSSVEVDDYGRVWLGLAFRSSAHADYWRGLAAGVFESHGEAPSRGFRVLSYLAEIADPQSIYLPDDSFYRLLDSAESCIGAGV